MASFRCWGFLKLVLRQRAVSKGIGWSSARVPLAENRPATEICLALCNDPRDLFKCRARRAIQSTPRAEAADGTLVRRRTNFDLASVFDDLDMRDDVPHR
jgi:hypothetical protein